MRHVKRLIGRAVGLALLLAAISFAQNPTGTISGVVKDETGAVIPSASVSAINEGTNARWTATSGADGNYTFRTLPIGSYRIEVEMSGFKRYEASGIRVQVNEIARVDPILGVGSVTESVEVQASVVHVDTETGTLKTVVDERRIEDLPLNGRDALQLMRLVAGVQLYEGSGVTSDSTYPGVVPVSVNGGRGNTVNYMLDGAQHNDHYNNAPSPMPNPDALAEFSVQTNNFSAEFGRNSGGVVNAVTKSGTNQLHGSAFGYLRHHVLNATNFFAPAKADKPNEREDDGLKRSQFGATLGGPIFLPKFYDGRDRSFFFFSYQGTRIRRVPSTQFNEVLTAAERNGDFSDLLPDQVLINPLTRQPFPNNQIPQSMMSPVATAFTKNFIPLPTGDTRRVITTTTDNFNDDQFLAKGDHSFGDMNRASGSVYISKASVPGFLNPKNYLELTPTSAWRNYSVSISDTHTFSPTLTNLATFGFNRTIGGMTPILPALGWVGLGSNIVEDTARQLYLSVQGPFTGFNTAETETFPRREYQASDIVRWMTNRHQVSIGGEYGYGQGDIAGNFRANGRFYFEHAAGFTGYAPADFLLGKFSRFQQSSGEFKQTRFHRFALFAQDTMRLSPRVTLGVGVRWEPFFPFSDKIGRLAGWNPGKQSTRFVNAPPNILYAGDPGIPAGVYKTAWKNFAPRVSLAFDLTGDGKTSLRLGYGLFYDTPNTISTNGQANQAPFGSSVTIRGTDVNSMSEPYAGFPGGNPFTLVGISAFGTSALIPPRDARFVLPMSATVDSMTNRNPYSQAWNLTLERELASSLVTRISYAGSKGTALLGGRDINAPLPDATASTATIDLRRPLYPNYTDVSLLESVGNSSFHSLQLTLEKRFSAGFSLLGNYMWSKSIDNNVGSANKGNGTSVTNPLNQKFDRGLSDFDKASVFNLSALWEIPVHLRNPLAAGILNNWNLSAIVAAQSGFPFTVLSGEDNARNDQGPQRADLVGNPKFSGGRSKGDKIAEWLRVDAFVPNALGTYGTLGRNTYRGPSMTNVDLGIQKRFPITENIVTEFRAEAFNVFNHTNLMNPINEMTETDFMRITDARDPRILQFALRVTW